jgi:hypothetical protein
VVSAPGPTRLDVDRNGHPKSILRCWKLTIEQFLMDRASSLVVTCVDLMGRSYCNPVVDG